MLRIEYAPRYGSRVCSVEKGKQSESDCALVALSAFLFPRPKVSNIKAQPHSDFSLRRTPSDIKGLHGLRGEYTDPLQPGGASRELSARYPDSLRDIGQTSAQMNRIAASSVAWAYAGAGSRARRIAELLTLG